MRADLPTVKYNTPEKRRLQFEAILSRVQSAPGIASVSLAETIPLGGAGRAIVEIDGRPAPTDTAQAQAITMAITPEYFETVGVTLRRGRAFSANDGSEGQANIIVNERFVARFFPGDDPIGKRLRVKNPRSSTAQPERMADDRRREPDHPAG